MLPVPRTVVDAMTPFYLPPVMTELGLGPEAAGQKPPAHTWMLLAQYGGSEFLEALEYEVKDPVGMFGRVVVGELECDMMLTLVTISSFRCFALLRQRIQCCGRSVGRGR